jgi:TonB family protein
MSWAHYLLQANIYLLVFYGFYKFLLDKETYFTWNRIYLVAAGILSLSLPLLRMELLTDQPVSQPFYTGADQLNRLMTEVTIAEDQSGGLSFGSFLAIAYVMGILFFFFRFMYQLFEVKRILKTATAGTALSFFNQSVIDPLLPEFKTIQHHEAVHSKQFHSIDVIFFEVLGILTWFNPIIYLYKHSLKSIHEYLADEEAAKFIGNKERYALLLVSSTFGVPLSQLTNSFFNQSLLKKRIYMLHQQKSAKAALLKYGLFLPLFALSLVFSSATLRSNEKLKEAAGEISLEKPLSLVQELVSTTTIQGWDEFYTFEKQNLKYPNEAITANKQGDVHIKFTLKDGKVNTLGVAGASLGFDLEDEVMRSILAYKKFQNIPNGDYLLTVNFRLNDHVNQAENTNEVTLAGYTKLNSIAVTRESRVHDFVSIDTQPSFPGGMQKFYEYLSQNLKYPAEAKANKVEGKVFLSFIVETDGHINHIRVDRKLGSGTDEEAVRVVEESPNWTPGILNGKPVRVKYNIPISFKLPDSTKVKVTGFKGSKDSTSTLTVTGLKTKPMYMLDGVKIMESELNKLSPNEIASVNVLKGPSAIAAYGENGKNGVLEIKTKAKSPNKATEPINEAKKAN